jgi:hypothetical protein
MKGHRRSYAEFFTFAHDAQGRMKPGGCRRFGRTQRCGVRINIETDV